MQASRNFPARVLAAAILAAAPQLLAQTPRPPAWDGTYHLDYEKSHLVGDDFTYAQTDGGTWTLFGDQSMFTFKADGKPYPLQDADHTESAVFESDHKLVITMQHKGMTVRTITGTLSPDGNTLTETTSGVGPGAFSQTQTSKRAREGSGFVGEWKAVALHVVNPPPSLMTMATAPDGTMTWTYGGNDTLTGKPDGTPLPVTGKGIPPGDTISFKKVSALRMDFVTAHDGTTRTVGFYQMSADGKQFDDTYWDPAEPAARETKVYVRQ